MQTDRETIISEFQRIAREKKGKTPTRSQFVAGTGISARQVYNHFDSWREFVLASGLKPHYQGITIEDEALFKEMQRVFLENYRICPQWRFTKSLKEYSINTYKRRFGQWNEVLLAFRQWIELNKIQFPYIDQLPKKRFTKERKRSKPVLRGDYVDSGRISELRAIKSEKFDLTRLVRLCEELNACYAEERFLAVAMLVRAILDHVPPIFPECKTFAEVANNYGGGAKSFKERMQYLENSARKLADAYLHGQIRKKETLPNKTQINFSSDLDTLLAEIVRILK